VATGDAWSDIMLATMKTKDYLYDCLEEPGYGDYVKAGFSTVGCGSKTQGILFFLSFYLLMNLIFLNLFIAIVLQGF
jgi:hypothetical protein